MYWLVFGLHFVFTTYFRTQRVMVFVIVLGISAGKVDYECVWQLLVHSLNIFELALGIKSNVID